MNSTGTSLASRIVSMPGLFGANHDVADAGHWNSGELALDDLSHPSAAAELGALQRFLRASTVSRSTRTGCSRAQT